MMTGVTEEIDLEDAIGIAGFMVQMGRIPPSRQWVGGLIDKAKADAVESIF